MRRARRWAWVLLVPDDLPPSDGILMGFQTGLPTKQLRIPRVSVRARARGPVSVREVVGSLGSLPPGGVIREIPSACDPLLRLARGSLQVLDPSDAGVRPLRGCDPLNVKSEPVPQFSWFFECVLFFSALASLGVVLQCLVAYTVPAYVCFADVRHL